MVYLGPSKGCRVCRTRRVKCDQLRPSCGNCVKRKQSCPGYEDTVDLMFRGSSVTTLSKRRKQIQPQEPTPNVLNSESTPTAIVVTRATTTPTGHPLLGNVVRRSVPRTLSEDLEDMAVCFFFDNYCSNPRNDGATTGYLQLLGQFYGAASRESPLSLATRAISLNFTNLWSSKTPDAGVANLYYAKAVVQTNLALADPVESRSDELLMTVLVLEFYDLVSRRFHNQDASDVHQIGATALIRHRGSSNFADRKSKQLLLAVRARTIQVAMTRKQGIDLDPRVWTDSDDTLLDPATQLDVFAAELCVLRGRLYRIRANLTTRCESERQYRTDKERFQELLISTRDLDARLVLWMKNLPWYWYPTTVSIDAVPPSIITVGLYGTYCDVYRYFQLAGVWNHYRCVRLGVLQILKKCVTYLSMSDDPLLLPAAQYTSAHIQRILDDICASVPYHLGDAHLPVSAQTYSKTICYPEASDPPRDSGDSQDEYHSTRYSHALTKGGWFMATALLTALRIEEPDEEGIMAFEIQKEQREWMLGQMKRIGHLYHSEDMPLW